MDMQTALGKTASSETPADTNAQAHTTLAAEQLAAQQAVLLRAASQLLAHDAMDSGLLAFVDELQRRFRCDRVALALHDDTGMRLRTLSGHATFDPRAAEILRLLDAMEEACAQDAATHFHPQTPNPDLPAHRALAGAADDREICCVPMSHDGELVGVVYFSRNSERPWARGTRQLMRQTGALAAPIIALRQRDEASVAAKARRRIRSSLKSALRLERPARKLAISALILALTLSALIPGPARVGAEAELLPVYRQVISAPYATFIEQVHVQPGAAVREGTPLLTLDTRELALERDNLANELLSARAEFRASMAARDRKSMAVAQARQQQIDARLAQIDQRIARASVLAPVDGVIISGDLRQSLGAPVARGDPLMEIAPANGYKAVLWVDEKDVSRLTVGQQGELSMRASPADGISFEITSIHPISTPEQGANRFRVETRLLSEPESLRPGHTGFGKVAVGSAPYLSLWTQDFRRWFLQLWWEWFG